MLSLSRPNQRQGTITTLTINLVVIGAPKFYVDRLETFDGTPIKWDSWEMGTSATLRQTIYNYLITEPPLPLDLIVQAWNRELYAMQDDLWLIHVAPSDGGITGS